MEDLIREMDRKIAKAKDRADKESMPKAIKAEDQVKLDELQARAKGEILYSFALKINLSVVFPPRDSDPHPTVLCLQMPLPSPKPLVRRGTWINP